MSSPIAGANRRRSHLNTHAAVPRPMSPPAGSAQREAPDAPLVDVEPLLEAGLARRAVGDLAGAEAAFCEALSHDPENASALYILGLTRFEAGDAAEAERLF